MAHDGSQVGDVLKRATLTDVPASRMIEWLGAAVDAAWDARRLDALRHIAETLAATVDRTALSEKDSCLLDYFLANAWNGIKVLSSTPPDGGWEWESYSTTQETIHLRRAVASEGLTEQEIIRVCQIHTNLANCYSTTGRFVEAVAEWDRALLIAPQFGMAKGNRAVGLWTYARSLYDHGHTRVMAREAWTQLDPSSLDGLEPGASAYFAGVRAEIEAAMPKQDLASPFDTHGFAVGDTEEERRYRDWCLSSRLFVNPLNDLGALRIAARDILTCPSTVVGIGEGPRFHDFLNQIKQEYCSARWLVYDGTREHPPHFSDTAVLLYNTLDYPSYGLRTEELKLGFRAAYSLLDKIAFFLNAYLNLGIAERDVSFRGLWYQKQVRTKGVRPEFTARENWPLRGLFWLGKDIYEEVEGFRESTDPAGKRLNEIRNHLEHKYLKIHSDLWGGPESGAFSDGLGVSLGRGEFEDMTMHLLRMTRAAIIYLTLGVHAEERARARRGSTDSIVAPIPLDTWDDAWKS